VTSVRVGPCGTATVAALVRVPTDTIAAPMFPASLKWLNVATLRMDKQKGRPVLLEFWDFCRPASLRTLPYLQAWHARYEAAGLRVISVHAPGFDPGRDEDAVARAVQRLGVEHPVLLDTELQLWRIYDNRGWPARYLFNQDLRLFEVHMGEGGYHETERAIQELLGIDDEPLTAYVHPEDDPEALVVVPTDDVPGAFEGPYEAGAVWAVLELDDPGTPGTIVVDGEERAVEYTGAHRLVAHDRHEAGVLAFAAGEGVTVHATLFTPGLAPSPAA
jgi:thiol-disulfide isomerase/thioredoxin